MHHYPDMIGAKLAPWAACYVVRSMSEAVAVREDLVHNVNHTVGSTVGLSPLAARVVVNRLPAADCSHSFR